MIKGKILLLSQFTENVIEKNQQVISDVSLENKAHKSVWFYIVFFISILFILLLDFLTIFIISNDNYNTLKRITTEFPFMKNIESLIKKYCPRVEDYPIWYWIRVFILYPFMITAIVFLLEPPLFRFFIKFRFNPINQKEKIFNILWKIFLIIINLFFFIDLCLWIILITAGTKVDFQKNNNINDIIIDVILLIILLLILVLQIYFLFFFNF